MGSGRTCAAIPTFLTPPQIFIQRQGHTDASRLTRHDKIVQLRGAHTKKPQIFYHYSDRSPALYYSNPGGAYETRGSHVGFPDIFHF